jgi:hypothetical protein
VTPAQVAGSSTDTLIQLLVAMAGTGSLVAVVQGLFTRRKTRAEVQETGASATKVITDAAAILVSNVQSDNVALRAELVALRGHLAQLQAWREAAERNFEIHERWDQQLADTIRLCTHRHDWPMIDQPPPLRPVVTVKE